ncbi:MAG: hypothetical protein GX862_04200, partial [Leucobacter sp.]|nr:hypothetical protein [Leucobacter sp.]
DADAGVPVIAPAIATTTAASSQIDVTTEAEAADAPVADQPSALATRQAPARAHSVGRSSQVSTAVSVARATPDPVLVGGATAALLTGAAAITSHLLLRPRLALRA